MTRRISYAQNGEDVRIWRALRHVNSPFYAEVGASDPLDDSITAALSIAGWSGVLFEPDPSMSERLRAARPRDVVVAAAAHSRAGVLRFDAGTARGLGHEAVGGETGVSVPAVRVADVLRDLQPEAVHVMTVDVEGHEADALRGADLVRWKPWVLAVEATRPNSREPAHQEWEPLVLEAGYRLVDFDGLNRWYVHEEHPELAEQVAVPYSALDEIVDGWQRRYEAELVAEVGELSAKVTEINAEASALRPLVGQVAALREAAADAQAVDSARRELEHQLRQVRHELAEALDREQVLLTSKSWRLTAPLRRTRKAAVERLEGRRSEPAPGAPAAIALLQPEHREADERRLQALASKVRDARRRAAR